MLRALVRLGGGNGDWDGICDATGIAPDYDRLCGALDAACDGEGGEVR